MRRVTAFAFASLLALASAACGSDDDPTVVGPSGSTSSTPSTSSTSERDDGADGDAFERGTLEHRSNQRAHLVSIEHASHDDFERIVFEFREAVPGVRVALAERPITEDGSGAEVAVEGDEVVLVRFEPASGFDLEASEKTYNGPSRIGVGREPVNELVRTGDFEAVLQWVVGVSRDARYRLTVLDGPPRAVIDIRSS